MSGTESGITLSNSICDKGVQQETAKGKNSLRLPRTCKSKVFLASSLFVIVGLCCLVTSVVIFLQDKSICTSPQKPLTQTWKTNQGICEFSEEAIRSGFSSFLAKGKNVSEHLKRHIPQAKYYKHLPLSVFLERYRAYNPDPKHLKHISDQSLKLHKDLLKLDINLNQLRLMELKSYYNMKHLLKSSFGDISSDYYAGLWMLGPNERCARYPTRSLVFEMFTFLNLIPNIESVTAAEQVIEIQNSFTNAFKHIKSNLQLGVRTGMIQNQDICMKGIKCPQFDLLLCPKSITYGNFSKKSTKKSREAELQWRKLHKQSIAQSTLNALGKTVQACRDLLKYLSKEYKSHCAPVSVVHGLVQLPLNYVYLNSIPVNRTTKILPTGEILNGSIIYQRILSSYLTVDITPDEVNKIGYDLVQEFSDMVSDLAKEYTNITNKEKAVEKFKTLLNSDEMFFNQAPFPQSETSSKCRNDDTAKLYCPRRYASMKEWIYRFQAWVNTIQNAFIHLFHYAGKRRSVSSCPVVVTSAYDATRAVPFYFNPRTDHDCTTTQQLQLRLPFFVDRYGPKYSDLTKAIHEVYPGHHLQIQDYAERFAPYLQCSNSSLLWMNDAVSRQMVYEEGWGVYCEFPLSLDTDIYDNKPLYKYGLINSQLLRAVRLIVDTGLHYRGISRQQAIEILENNTWEDNDVSQKEISRYQINPGQACTYSIGQLKFIQLRKKAKDKLSEKFDIKDFHYYILSYGSVTLDFLEVLVDRYIECALANVTYECLD